MVAWNNGGNSCLHIHNLLGIQSTFVDNETAYRLSTDTSVYKNGDQNWFAVGNGDPWLYFSGIFHT